MSTDQTSQLFARYPWKLGLDEWKAVIRRVWDQQGSDDLSTRASAVAFSAMFAIPSLLIAVVSLYGLVSSPAQVSELVSRAGSVVPEAAVELLRGQLENLTSQNSGALSAGVAAGLAGAIWSVSGGLNRLRDTLNEVYGEEDTRPWYVKRAWAIASSLAVILVLVTSVGLIAVLPAVTDWIGLEGWSRSVVIFGRWLVLTALIIGLLAMFYRLGPKRRAPRLQWISVGTVLAAVAWVIMSIGFSIYVQNFSSYNETYGSLGSVIVFMTWLYLSAYIVLLAGEVNSELEHQTLADTTVGPDRRIGQRNAHVADTIPDDVAAEAHPDLLEPLQRSGARREVRQSGNQVVESG